MSAVPSEEPIDAGGRGATTQALWFVAARALARGPARANSLLPGVAP